MGLGTPMRESDRGMMARLQLSPEEFHAMLEQLGRLIAGLDRDLSPLARALLAGDTGQIERLLRDAALAMKLDQTENGIPITGYTQRISGRLGLDGVQLELEGFKGLLPQLGVETGTLERISWYVDERLKDLARMIRELIRQELRKSDNAFHERHRWDYLSQKSFSYYTEEDIRRMNEVVTRLAQRFKSLLSLRRKRARRGRFDVKETLRRNLQYGGIPFRIQLDRRRREKPEVVILCDISDSVLNASRFMLQFVYSIQGLYSKVRSFVFVSDIGEVTQLFEENEIQQAVDMALRGEVIDVFSHSNFGRAFKAFYQEYRSAVNGKTTFLIIGDGRNNYNHPNDWVLREIRQKAKQLIWLNPESRLTWGFGDSEMPRYIPHCDIVEECRNINQLSKLIDRIVT
jgi:uncharacterized protein with von Willebrand factor type A (vWA) domain